MTPAAVTSGGRADRSRPADRRARLIGIGLSNYVEGTGRGPFESAGNPTFKALFNSWKKLDQLQDGVIAIPSEKHDLIVRP